MTGKKFFSQIVFSVLITAACIATNVGSASSAVKTGHPRLMDQTWIDQLSSWSNDGSWGPWVKFRAFADRDFGAASTDHALLFSKALMWKMGKGTSYLNECLSKFDSVINAIGGNADRIGSRAQFAAMAYDLLYHQLPVSSRKNAVDEFIEWQDLVKASANVRSQYVFWNYGIRKWGASLVACVAGMGDPSNSSNDLSTEYNWYMDHFINPGLYWLENASKAVMPEGLTYGTSFDTYYWLQAIDAIYMANNRNNIYSANGFFDKQLNYLWQSFLTLPKFYDEFDGDKAGRYYHPWGHAVMNRAKFTTSARVSTLILLSRVTHNRYRAQIAHSLYGNNDPDLDEMTSTFYNSATNAFIYGCKNITPNPPSLQLWSSNVGEQYGAGYSYLRSGYDKDDIYISFKAGDMFWRGHENLEEGSFQIFAKGEDLAIHSGTYAGSGELVQTTHYFSSTVSTNSLIIYDPDEKFYFVGRDKDNDGGQRTFTGYPQMYSSSNGVVESLFTDWATNSNGPSSNTGKNPAGVNHHAKTVKSENVQDQYSYVFSDLTRAYNSDEYVEGSFAGNKSKVSKVTRELALLNNKYVVIFDKLAKKHPTDYSANPSVGEPHPYQDKWLLHTQTSFSVNGTKSDVSSGEQLYKNGNGSFSTIVDNSALHGKVVYPESDFQIRKFNGSKRYWNYQRNIPIADNQGNWSDVEWGADRIEIEPTDAGLAHNYLVVLYPEKKSGPSMPAVAAVNVQTALVKGMHVKDAAKNIIALFSSDLSTDQMPVNVQYNVNTTASSKHYLFGLSPNTAYIANINGSNIAVSSSDSGVVTFSTAATGPLTVILANSDGPTIKRTLIQ